MPHHLLGCVDVSADPWTVGKYALEAAKTVKEIRSRGNVPVVVGGTGYYLQALALRGGTVVESEGFGWKEAEVSKRAQGEDSGNGDFETHRSRNFLTADEEEARWPVLRESSEVLLAELRKVDPVMAARWHPNDRRKIRRSLAVYLQTGRKASEIYAEQKTQREREQALSHKVSGNGVSNHSSETDSEIPSALRHDTLLFYLHSASSSLDNRLEARIHDMLERGLLDELHYLRGFHSSLIAAGKPPDLTRGIWVAIGYKEFAPYLDAIEADTLANSGVETYPEAEGQKIKEREEKEKRLAKLRADCIQRMVIATRQYARSQEKWVRGKLLPALQGAGAQHRLFVLDASDATRFGEVVQAKAAEVVRQFLAGEELPSAESVYADAREVLRLDKDGFGSETIREVRVCERCNVTVVTAKEWEKHLKSTKHKRSLKRERQRGERELRRAMNESNTSEQDGPIGLSIDESKES